MIIFLLHLTLQRFTNSILIHVVDSRTKVIRSTSKDKLILKKNIFIVKPRFQQLYNLMKGIVVYI